MRAGRVLEEAPVPNPNGGPQETRETGGPAPAPEEAPGGAHSFRGHYNPVRGLEDKDPGQALCGVDVAGQGEEGGAACWVELPPQGDAHDRQVADGPEADHEVMVLRPVKDCADGGAGLRARSG